MKKAFELLYLEGGESKQLKMWIAAFIRVLKSFPIFEDNSSGRRRSKGVQKHCLLKLKFKLFFITLC